MKKLLDVLKQYWLLLLLGVGLAIIAYLLLFRSLGTLPGGYSPHEAVSQAKAASLRTIARNPVNAPYELLIWASLKLGYHSLLATRLAAVTIAIAAAGLFYWIVLHWYSKRIAIISTILFVGSSGYLHIARYGTALILQMATLALIGCVWLYQRARQERTVTYCIAVLLAIFAYIPGMLWFQILGLIVLRKDIVKLFQRLGSKHTTAILALYLVLITPIFWGAAHNIHTLLPILGLPSHMPTLSTLIDNKLLLIKALVYRGYYPSDYWLYGAPLLTVAEAIFFMAGLFQLCKRPMATVNYWLAAALLISAGLVILGGGATIAMLIPLIYLVIAGGIYYLLNQWLNVFPRNPIARNTGVILLCLTVMFSVYYHFRAYYIAWPRAPETEQVYIIKP